MNSFKFLFFSSLILFFSLAGFSCTGNNPDTPKEISPEKLYTGPDREAFIDWRHSFQIFPICMTPGKNTSSWNLAMIAALA